MTISPPVAGAAVGNWTIDPAATTVTISVKKLGLFTIRAALTVNDGQIDIDDDGRIDAVRVSLDAASYHSPNDKRNEHVRGADFLDSETHPVLAFRAEDIVPNGESYAVTGVVTVKGAESPVTADVRNVDVGTDSATFSLAAELDRRKLGVGKLPSFFVGDLLQLEVDATARRQSVA